MNMESKQQNSSDMHVLIGCAMIVWIPWQQIFDHLLETMVKYWAQRLLEDWLGKIGFNAVVNIWRSVEKNKICWMKQDYFHPKQNSATKLLEDNMKNIAGDLYELFHLMLNKIRPPKI